MMRQETVSRVFLPLILLIIFENGLRIFKLYDAKIAEKSQPYSKMPKHVNRWSGRFKFMKTLNLKRHYFRALSFLGHHLQLKSKRRLIFNKQCPPLSNTRLALRQDWENFTRGPSKE